MKRFLRLSVVTLSFASVLALSACCHAEKVHLTPDVAWVRASDAYRCCVEQAYLNAMNRLRERAKGMKPGTWCVVLDADETVISNVRFQAELQASGGDFTNEAWTAWCKRGEATLLPGAGEFCSLAKELGGKVIIVTNRKEIVKDATLKNLTDAGLTYDVCLVREGPYAEDRSKVLRREAIEKGTVATLPEGMTLPPLRILMLCGDQTHDLYKHEESFDSVKDRFAADLVIIPNPMYGDWYKSSLAYIESEKPSAEAPAEAITWKEAMGKVGENVLVEGTIVKVYVPDRGPAKLNFDENWRESLTVAVFGAEKFGDLRSSYLDKKVRVSGKVDKWRDSVQIKVSDPSQIQVIE